MRCGDTVRVTATASASGIAGKLGEAELPGTSAPRPGHEPIASRAATSPSAEASTSAPSASSASVRRRETAAVARSANAHSPSRSNRNAQTGPSQPGTLARNVCSERSNADGG